jgi:AcrR family transcriptional regulator
MCGCQSGFAGLKFLMSWHKDGPGGRKGYHHGNLREALIEAALNLISEKGPGGLTFAEAARAAGVSGAAPYRHFRDRDELMADVALRGYEMFATQLAEGWNGGQPDPFAAFNNLGRSYLRFARSEPALFAAMFESGLVLSDYPKVAAAADRAFEVLRNACEMLSATSPAGKRPPALMMALHIWSLSHGIASLFGRGDAARRPIPMSAEELLEAAVLIYLDGLGISRS